MRADSLAPVFVDLDGTLVLTDTLHEAFLSLLKAKPWLAFQALFYVLRGRSRFKERVAELSTLQYARLPFNHALIDYLEAQKDRRLILATGAPRKVALAVAEHLGIFEGVLCTSGAINLTGERKATAITNYLDGGDFTYAGNSRADLPIWARAKSALVVNASPSIRREVTKLGVHVDREFPRTASPWRLLFR